MTDIAGILSLVKAEDFISFTLLHFTTAIMVMYVVVKFFGVQFKWGRLLLAAFIYGAAMNLIRKVYLFCGIPLGTHTLYLMVIKGIILYALLRLRFFEAVLGSVLTTVLILAATPAAMGIIKLLHIDFKSLSDNPWLFSLVGHVEGVYLIIAVIFLAFTNLNVYKTFGWKR